MQINPSYIVTHNNPTFQFWDKVVRTQKVFFYLAAKFKLDIRTGLFALSIKKNNRRLEASLIQFKGILALIKESTLDPEVAKEALTHVRTSLHTFRSSMEVYESVSYFGNATTQALCKSTLDTIYQVEFLLRKQAFKTAKPKHKTSEEAEFTARMSRRSLRVNH